MLRSSSERIPNISSEADPLLQSDVYTLLRSYIVYGDGSSSFGLRWRPYDINLYGNDTPPKSGSWMLKKYGLRGKSWKKQFCVLEDHGSMLKLCKDENMVQDSSIQLEDVISVQAKYSSSNRYYFLSVRTLSTKSDDQVVELKPIEDSNVELVIRWTAFLQYHCGLYDDSLTNERNSAILVALAMQSIWRGYKTRRSMKKRINNRPSMSFKLSNLVSKLYRDTEMNNDQEFLPEEKHMSKRVHKPALFQCNSNIDVAKLLPPLDEGEVEDEIWENQRWQVVAVKGKVISRGWGGDISLLPTDRSRFSDRIGRGNFKCPTSGKIGVPPGWKVTKEFCIDRSGVVNAKCDSDGWYFHTAFPQLDTDYAKGLTKSQPSSIWLVRRRRWYRRRIQQIPSSPKMRKPSWLVHHGWLAMRGANSNRWKSRYCLLIKSHDKANGFDPRVGKKLTGDHASWTYFKYSYREHNEEGELVQHWNEISSRHLKSRLVFKESVIRDTVASPTCPGYFMLQRCPEEKPRLINATTDSNRKVWVNAFREVIETSQEMKISDRMRISNADKRISLKGTGLQVMKTLKGALRIPGDIIMQTGMNNGVNHVSAVTNSIANVPSLVISKRMKLSRANSDTVSFKNDLAQDSTMLPEDNAAGTSHSEFESESENGNGILDEESEKLHFVVPENLDNDISCTEFNITVDKLNSILFEDDSFDNSVYRKENYSDIVRGEWSNGKEVGSKREVNYIMPKKGLVPSNRSFISMLYVQSIATMGYQIDFSISSPDVPYGGNFLTGIRFVLVALDNNRCQLTISQGVKFTKSTVMKSFIKTGTKREVGSYYRNNWIHVLEDWIGANSSTPTTTKPLKHDGLVQTNHTVQEMNIPHQQVSNREGCIQYGIFIVLCLILLELHWLRTGMVGRP